ncbi:MAG: PQQ-binding-like beta-propeller repeat protein, partial [Phycisphaerae bacterium]|nr:PQQ-binding-like beta-propeller repeat protein [Phycisphaerae bacterium]
MKSIVAEIVLAVVVGVAVWAIVMMSGSAGPEAEVPASAPHIDRPVTTPSPGGSFGPSDVADAHWPIFRGDQALRGTAKGSPGDSLKLIWTFRTNGPVKSSVAVGGGRVFATSGDSNVYALNLLDGRKLWSFPTGGPVEAPPLLVDEMVFVGSTDSHLYAIDAETGEEKWKYKTGAQIIGSANWLRTAAGQTRILFGSYDESLHCVDAADGKAVWTYETEHYINGAPTVADGQAGFGNCDGFVYVVNIADGTLARKIDFGAPVVGSPAVMD